MIDNILRCGNFTSSNIYKLLTKDRSGKGFGEPALTYIQEKNMERDLGRSIYTETDAKATQWGKLCEGLVFDELALSYTLCSQDTLRHPQIPYWTGSPDGTTNDAVMDIKCPFTLKAFFLLTKAGNIRGMLDGFEYKGQKFPKHKDGEKFYWQLVSNAILAGKPYAELIVNMPLLKDIPAIRAAGELQGYNWLKYSYDSELPYLKDDCGIENRVTIRFEVPEADKQLLTDTVLLAGKQLIEPNTILIKRQDDGIITAEGKIS